MNLWGAAWWMLTNHKIITQSLILWRCQKLLMRRRRLHQFFCVCMDVCVKRSQLWYRPIDKIRWGYARFTDVTRVWQNCLITCRWLYADAGRIPINIQTCMQADSIRPRRVQTARPGRDCVISLAARCLLKQAWLVVANSLDTQTEKVIWWVVPTNRVELSEFDSKRPELDHVKCIKQDAPIKT